MSHLFFYLTVIFFSLSLYFLYPYSISNSHFIKKTIWSYHTVFDYLFALIPVIILTGFRYGIGTDYFSYEKIFNLSHNTSFLFYINKHFSGDVDYYIEIGWYLINKFFCFNYCSLLFVVEILINVFLYNGFSFFKNKLNIPVGIFIYFCTQLIYSWNAMRYAVAIAILFSGFRFIIENKKIKWVLTVFVAMCFHKTSIICLPFCFLSEFSSAKINQIRNFLLYIFVLFFPFIIKIILYIVAKIPYFKRYFSAAVYMIGKFHLSPMFLFHIVPVIVPLILFRKKYIKEDYIAKVLFRIYLLELPFREIGAVNTWFTRLARMPQMVELVFIPYILASLPKSKRIVLYLYYFCWYIFYFIYYAMVNDAGDSIPYRSIILAGGY